MIVVRSVDELPPEIRTKVKAEVLRKLVQRLYNSPHISEETLMQVVGFNRATLNQMYETMYAQAVHHKAAASYAEAGYAEAPYVGGQPTIHGR